MDKELDLAVTCYGKVKPLKYDLAGKLSRRITGEHRLVYQVEGNNLIVFTCRYHY